MEIMSLRKVEIRFQSEDEIAMSVIKYPNGRLGAVIHIFIEGEEIRQGVLVLPQEPFENVLSKLCLWAEERKQYNFKGEKNGLENK